MFMCAQQRLSVTVEEVVDLVSINLNIIICLKGHVQGRSHRGAGAECPPVGRNLGKSATKTGKIR